MAKRGNHYEAAFEAYLRARRVPYVAVDETRRSLAGDTSLKSLDFIVSSVQGTKWLVDVKGRRFPSGDQGRYWTNWSTRDDLRSLFHWEQVFGGESSGLFVFAYDVIGERSPLPPGQLFRFRDRIYGFVAVRLKDYAKYARPISPKWDTLAVPVPRFRGLAVPVEAYVEDQSPAAAL